MLREAVSFPDGTHMQLFKIEIRITKSELHALKEAHRALDEAPSGIPSTLAAQPDVLRSLILALILVARPEPVTDLSDAELAKLREFARARKDQELLTDLDTAHKDESAYKRCVRAWNNACLFG